MKIINLTNEDKALFSLMLVSGSGPQKWISLVSRCPTEKLQNQFLLKATRSIKHKVQKRTGYPTAIADVYLYVCVHTLVCLKHEPEKLRYLNRI